MTFVNRDSRESQIFSSNQLKLVLPSHVIYSDKKRRQRRTYTKIVQRAGFFHGNASICSLSCIEPENHAGDLSLHDPSAKQKVRQRHTTTRANSVAPWLGVASVSLMSNIQSSRISDVFVRPRTTEERYRNDADENDNQKVTAKRKPVSAPSNRILNIRTPIAAVCPLGQCMFKTKISDGFGKMIYPNGTVFIGMLENDVPHGHGKALYQRDASYEGSWNKGNREGQGRFIFPDGGGYYDGGFLHNNFHGAGEYTSNVSPISIKRLSLSEIF